MVNTERSLVRRNVDVLTPLNKVTAKVLKTNEEDIFTFDESVDEATGKRRHDYVLNGKPLTGVTTILKVLGKGDVLVQWSANQTVEYIKKESTSIRQGHETSYLVRPDTLDSAKFAWKSTRDTAGDFGTNVHKAIEEWIKEDKNFPILTETEQKAFDNFRDWSNTNKVTFVESEKRLYSKKHWYAGTLDLLMEVDGKLYIGDIKTSAGIYPEHFFQMAGYDIALNEMSDKYRDIEGYIVVNLKKDGKITWKKSYDRKGNIEAFEACLTLHRQKALLENTLKSTDYKRTKIAHGAQK